VLLLLVGCSFPGEPSAGTAGDVPADPPSSTQDPDDDVDDAGDEPDGTVQTCPAPVRAAIEVTIGAQLDAFADDDVAGAFSYASEAFRAQTDVASFERLITGAFPAVADPVSFSVGRCRSERASAQVLIAVVGADGGRMGLVYDMVDEAGRWAIDGARQTSADPGMVA